VGQGLIFTPRSVERRCSGLEDSDHLWLDEHAENLPQACTVSPPIAAIEARHNGAYERAQNSGTRDCNRGDVRLPHDGQVSRVEVLQQGAECPTIGYLYVKSKKTIDYFIRLSKQRGIGHRGHPSSSISSF
jgi:hypothetical protein